MGFFYFQKLNVVLEENKEVVGQKDVKYWEMTQANLNLVSFSCTLYN